MNAETPILPHFELSIGADLDRWGRCNGARPRNRSEPDAHYREVIRNTVGKWAMIHPDFGQSITSERWAIQQNELALIERKRRFNAAVTAGCEPEFCSLRRSHQHERPSIS